MRPFLLLIALLGVFCVGCAGGETVSEQDARDFSKTPDGKGDTGMDEVNNNR